MFRDLSKVKRLDTVNWSSECDEQSSYKHWCRKAESFHGRAMNLYDYLHIRLGIGNEDIIVSETNLPHGYFYDRIHQKCWVQYENIIVDNLDSFFWFCTLERLEAKTISEAEAEAIKVLQVYRNFSVELDDMLRRYKRNITNYHIRKFTRVRGRTKT